MTPDKRTVHLACLSQLEAKLVALQSDLDDLSAGTESESKSSAGDKHETGRAMMHLEQDRLGKHWKDLKAQHSILLALDPERSTSLVTRGSLIHVEQGWFYLSIALGRVEVGGFSVLTLSPESPLGQAWMGKKKGDVINFRGIAYHVLELA